jgi:hypothetical protein
VNDIQADPRQATADRYYKEGCALVEVADRYWAQAHDPSRAADMRAASLTAYSQVAARAITKFRRHDMMLELITRDPR